MNKQDSQGGVMNKEEFLKTVDRWCGGVPPIGANVFSAGAL
jgi:hypothetical protein